MALYRCNQCGFVAEEAAAVGSKIPCAKCAAPSTVFDTVFYVEKLLERYFAAVRDLKALQESAPALGNRSASSAAAPPAAAAAVAPADIHRTNAWSTAEQHAPLQQWFAARRIDAQFDYARTDTSGFYDDAACMLGNQYELFGELIDRVCFAYRKMHSNVTLDLNRISQKDGVALNKLCRELYDHTFFARYFYQKNEKVLRLTLQSAPAIRQFFEGGWLEWYAFMALAELTTQQRQAVSLARGVKVVFENEDLHELDVVALPAGQSPICIECKSGEFRRDLDKYLRLRKRLDMDRRRFIICSADLTADQAQGLNAMYELSFVNLQTLKPYLQQVLGQG